MTTPKEWYTVDEAAEYLRVSRRTIYKLSKEGRLRTYVLGRERTRRFRRDDLDQVPHLLRNGSENNSGNGASADLNVYPYPAVDPQKSGGRLA